MINLFLSFLAWLFVGDVDVDRLVCQIEVSRKYLADFGDRLPEQVVAEVRRTIRGATLQLALVSMASA